MSFSRARVVLNGTHPSVNLSVQKNSYFQSSFRSWFDFTPMIGLKNRTFNPQSALQTATSEGLACSLLENMSTWRWFCLNYVSPNDVTRRVHLLYCLMRVISISIGIANTFSALIFVGFGGIWLDERIVKVICQPSVTITENFSIFRSMRLRPRTLISRCPICCAKK